MSYIKKYGIGNVRLEAPYSHFIYELPLLSFGDVQHTVGLTLVFNSRFAAENPFYMANGYKLNIQKRLVMSNGVPVSYEDGYGKLTALNKQGDRYSFDDDTQRFIGAAGNDFRLDNPDYSREIYDNQGRIKSVADKYGVTYLNFTYDGLGKLSSITFRSNKVIGLTYGTGGVLSSITYSYNGSTVCTTNIAYSGLSSAIVTHYSGVRYYIAYSGGSFFAYSTDESGAYSDAYSHRLDCTKTSARVVIQRKIGSKITDRTQYDFLKLTSDNKIVLMDVTDFHGIKTRVQFSGDYPVYSYEFSENMFSSDDTTPNRIYLGNVNFHIKDQISGIQSYTDGVKLDYMVDEYGTRYDRFDDNQNIPEALMLSGWLKSVDNVSECNIVFYNGETIIEYKTVSILTENSWMYFSVGIPDYPFNNMHIFINVPKERVQMADFRLIYNEENNHTTTEENVFIFNASEIFPFDDETEFYFCTEEEASAAMESGDYSTLSSLNLTDHYIMADDIVRYQINEIKGNYTNEAYIDNCRHIIVNAKPLMVKIGESLWDVTAVSVGKRYKRGAKTYLTRNNVRDGDILLTTISYIDGSEISRQEYNTSFDVVYSTTDGLGTVFQYASDEYGRGTGLVTRKTVGAISTTAAYDLDDYKLVSTTDEFGVSTGYTTDLTWGVITATSCGGTSVSDEFDGDMSTVQEREFSGTSGTRLHEFDYTNGNLSSLVTGTLSYGFDYSFGSPAGVSKGGTQIEQHTLESSDTVLNSFYPAEQGALYSVISHTDSYGRLTKIEGVIENTYMVAPIYGAREFIAVNADNGSARLARSTDLTNGNVTKYAYSDDKVCRAEVFNSSGTSLGSEEYDYDSLGRLTSNTYSFGTKTVGSSFTYLSDEDAYNADERIGSASYLVNGAVKATATNYFDSYKRIRRKLISIGNAYDREITYTQTRITRVCDVKNGSTINNVSYGYDSMGRITSEADSVNTNANTTYVYDSFGQLIRENNKSLDKTFVYSYNGIGNITSVKTYAYTTAATPSGTYTEQAYGYNNTSHPDRLTSFGGKGISYNTLGCPISHDGMSYVWTKGKLTRQFCGSKAQAGTLYKDTVFTYDGYGRRTAKSYAYDPNPASTSDYSYTYDTTYDYDNSGRLVREYCTEKYIGGATNTRDITYLYDESGVIGAIHTYNSTTDRYYFDRNIRGDVTAIYNNSGTKIATYSYDSWGNCTIKTLVANNFSSYNPIRYRGYYYDRETGLYYLNARYYNPEWRRFISPDSTEYIDPENPNGLNLYAYCNNDPVNYADPSGHFALTTFGLWAIVGIVSAAVVIGGGAQLLSNSLAGETGVDLWYGVAGAALGTGANALALLLIQLSPIATIFASAGIGALVQTTIDSIETIIRGKQIDMGQTIFDLGLNYFTTVAGNYLGHKLIPTNAGWFKPQHFLSAFAKPYGQKVIAQTLIGAGLSGIINFIRKFDWSTFESILPAYTVPLYQRDYTGWK